MAKTSKERLEILKMIQEGKITPEEGIRLLEAIEADDFQKKSGKTDEPKWLVVEISSKYLGKDKKFTPVRIPFSVITVLSRFIPKNPLKTGGDDDISAFIESLKKGENFSLQTENEDRWVKIYTE